MGALVGPYLKERYSCMQMKKVKQISGCLVTALKHGGCFIYCLL